MVSTYMRVHTAKYIFYAMLSDVQRIFYSILLLLLCSHSTRNILISEIFLISNF